MADGDDGCRPEQEPGPEPGEEFEIVDRSQVPGPGELRRATKGWSAPILTLARRATGTLSASCGSALRAAASLSGAESGADDVVRAGRLWPGTLRELSIRQVVVLPWVPGWQDCLTDSAC